MSLVLLFAVLCLVWWPVLSHYYVAAPAVPEAVLAAHHRTPSDAVLSEIADMSLISDHPITGKPAVRLARLIVEGWLELPNMGRLRITPRFAAADLTQGSGWQQLATASLIVPDLLMRAYETTPDPVFIETARAYLLSFLAFESRQWLPTGFLWNSHAVATRAGVLIRFWRLHRGRIGADPATERPVLSHVIRIAEMLLKPSHFVVATNQGVMANIALLQISVAFPALPRSIKYRDIAMERLREQMRFYVAEEGIVLEHSPGYHFTGTVLLAFVTRLLELSGEAVPADWRLKRARALTFFARIRRPDGTLPMFGDTMDFKWTLPASVSASHAAARPADGGARAVVYPVAGYALWWDHLAGADIPADGRVQTALTWSHFPGHGHERPQEMSLSIWSGGTTWLTNSGYWPFDTPGLGAARGWDGSNAPHVVGETETSERATTLRAVTDTDGVRMLDLERVVTRGPRVRRQLVQLDGAVWLVLDSYADDAGRPLRVLWTTYPGVTVRREGDRRFGLSDPDGARRMSLSVRGSPDLEVQPRQGSQEPFGGWVSVDRRPTRAHAIDARLRSPAGWVLTVARLELDHAGTADERADPIVAANVVNPDQWRFAVASRTGRVSVRREGSRLLITRATALPREIALAGGPDVAAERALIGRALVEAQARYPRYRDVDRYRVRASGLLAASWVLVQSALAIGLKRNGVFGPIGPTLRALGNVGWAAGALWIVFGYLGG